MNTKAIFAGIITALAVVKIGPEKRLEQIYSNKTITMFLFRGAEIIGIFSVYEWLEEACYLPPRFI